MSAAKNRLFINACKGKQLNPSLKTKVRKLVRPRIKNTSGSA